jgi:hypothetical protein
LSGCVVANAVAFDDYLSVEDELAYVGLFAEVPASGSSALHVYNDDTFDATVTACLVGDNGEAERFGTMNRHPEVFVRAQVAVNGAIFAYMAGKGYFLANFITS